MSTDASSFRKFKGFQLKILDYSYSIDPELVPVLDTVKNPLFNPALHDPEQIVDAAIQFVEDEINGRTSSELLMAKGAPVYLGIDSEYQNSEIDPLKNIVLSYQACLFTELGILKAIIYLKGSEKKDRVSFYEFTHAILRVAQEKDLIRAWPSLINVCAHFMRADITHFRDFWRDKRKVDSLRGTVTTLSSNYSPAESDEFNSHDINLKPLVMESDDWSSRRVNTRLIDTFLLTPGSQGLDAAGELIGFEKLTLPEGYSKDKMADFLRERPDEFEAYAIRDAEIAVRYALRMRDFAKRELQLKRLPATIGSMAMDLFVMSICEQDNPLKNDDFLKFFGREPDVKELVWNDKWHRYDEKKGNRVNDHRLKNETFVTLCYHGGRNECYGFGAFEGRGGAPILDFDLIGAYTTGLLDIYALDYAQSRSTLEVADFLGHVCGFAKVHFQFPDTTQYPCLPIQTGARGLFYPLTGVSYCTAPEIRLAHDLGATLTIEIGLIVPWATPNIRVFEAYVTQVRRKRLYYKAKGDSFSEQLWKELGNSLYGKLAQGLKPKNAFDSRLATSRVISPSTVSNPYYAAHVTGFVRAVVSEVIARCGDNHQVMSITTDGFLTDATADQLDTSGYLARRFQDLLDRLDANANTIPPELS